jgi:hypothetical protein
MAGYFGIASPDIFFVCRAGITPKQPSIDSKRGEMPSQSMHFSGVLVYCGCVHVGRIPQLLPGATMSIAGWRKSIVRRLAGLSLILILLAATEAHAQDRVALVIGNSAYLHAAKLPNPVNDADAVSLLLKSAGFTVVEARHDLGINEMRRSIRDFSDMTRNADMAVVYYAGHGIEVDGSNYLVPIDAVLQRDIDVEDETVSLNRVLQVIEPAKRLRLVILDACRDNPFAKTMKRTMTGRSIGRGLASVEPTTSNTLIAFAAKGGSTADDGGGSHSPFTTALQSHG